MRINIDITGADGETTSHTMGSASHHAAAAHSTGAGHDHPPAHVLAEAAATGAINAGPAPAMPGAGPGVAPIATSVGGHHGTPAAAAASAGGAPERVMGTTSH